MAAVGERYAKLMNLAQEASSDKRRLLLNEVTDMFIASREQRTEISEDLFGDILTTVAADMETAVRAELSNRFADMPDMPRRLALAFAHDDVMDVAEPVLTRARVLTEHDLLGVIGAKGNDHMEAIARRPMVSERVTEALVARGDDRVAISLMRNQTAQLSRKTMETVVDRAGKCKELHEPVIERKALPSDLLFQMYDQVEAKLRKRVIARFADVDPKALEEALATSRAKMASLDGKAPDDYPEAVKLITALRQARGINGATVVNLIREKKTTAFYIGLAEMLDLDFIMVKRMVEEQDLDGLATACRAAGFDRALFVTIAVLSAGADDALGKATQMGEMYTRVPVEAAQRAMRFFRLRRSAA
ncbi:MAG: DUF2336 domain-containing protein [Caulobacterales bacterium]